MIQFTVPLPPRELSSNARVHWRTRHEHIAQYRLSVFADTRNAKVPELQKARISLTFCTKGAKGRFYQPRDASNAVDSFKAGFDALVDANVLPDDSQKHLELGVIRIDPQRGPFVEVVVEPI